MKKILLTALSFVLVAALAIGGTLAYLTDRDAKTNVFTVGDVDIEQIELQRKDQSAGYFSDNLEPFENGKLLCPAVYDEISWADSWQEWASGGSSALFNSDMKNIIDKFVFAENTGKNDAYVRTWFAFEAGNLSFERFDEIMHININDTHWDWSEWNTEPVEIDGVKYYIISATYTGTEAVHTGGVLPAGETTRPSLLQIFLDKTTTSEESNSMGEEYTLLVRTQAVQVAGLENADEAFEKNFGSEHPWNK